MSCGRVKKQVFLVSCWDSLQVGGLVLVMWPTGVGTVCPIVSRVQ